MKIQKNILALLLILAFLAGFGVCAAAQSQNLHRNTGTKANEYQPPAKPTLDYADQEPVNAPESIARPSISSATDEATSYEDAATTDEVVSSEENATPVSNREEHLPILMTYSGTWLDQDGAPMSYADAERFFKRNREYAKVAVAINSLCEELQSDARQYDLNTVHDWATASPHDTDEYLAYEWILSEMEANYDNYLNDLLALIGDQIDFDSSPAANVATCIILEKMLEFRDDGTYEASINPHRKHDCNTEGCYAKTATSPDPAKTPAIDTLTLTDKPTSAEIIALLDSQVAAPTTFDRQHPNLYFDRLGRVHGAANPTEEYYYATASGKVYQLCSNTDVDRIGESPLFYANLRGSYVGETNRILK